MKSVIFSLILISISLYGIEFSGFADSYLSISTVGKAEVVNNYQRFRGNLSASFDESFIFASVNGRIDNISGDKELSIHELYLDYENDIFNLRFGKQLVVWGNGDGVRITDLICPSDLNEIMAQEFDDIRVPLSLVRLKSDLDIFSLELLWIPLYEGDKYPRKSSPYYFKPMVTDSLLKEYEPDKALENSEFAGKISLYHSSFDLALSYLNTWSDSPVYFISPMNIKPHFFRNSVVGVEISKPIESFVIRGETALYLDSHFTGTKNKTKNKTKSIIGIDYYPNNSFSLSGQYINDKIWDYEDFILEDENQHMATLNTKLSLLRETLNISNMIYFSFNENELANNFTIDYAISDNLHILTGFNYFDVEEESILFEKSQVWVKGKISF
ncbi:MAG: hypothetical protein CR982_00435 [Candidatus Cloacimonadota bacterium]|nr:MAG: hypothetical protein CR982_00435 [Candidatus Cloacimonadota bacterium]PIE78767.1 MAG: hypothetical protein CSA15_06195 [Candidatus Delongbacteria bacterium]